MRDQLIERAVQFAEMGVPVVPTNKDKKSLVLWKHWQQEAAPPETVTWWFGTRFRWSMSYGIITGQFSGLVVVETDNLDAVEHVLGNLPGTPCKQRSRKGIHFGFRHPGHHVKTNQNVGMKGIDVRGDGGLVIGPGSIHKSGHVYAEIGQRWTPDLWASCPVYDPRWLAPDMDEEPEPVRDYEIYNGVPSGDRIEQARRYLSGCDGTTPGGGASNTCFRLAGKLVYGFGLSPDEALPILVEWGVRGDQRDRLGAYYPWTVEELRHKLEDVARKPDPKGRPTGYLLRPSYELTVEEHTRLNRMKNRHQQEG